MSVPQLHWFLNYRYIFAAIDINYNRYIQILKTSKTEHTIYYNCFWLFIHLFMYMSASHLVSQHKD